MKEPAITHILFDLGNVLVSLRPVEHGAAMCPALATQQSHALVVGYECGRIPTSEFVARAPHELGLHLTTEQFRVRFQSIIGDWYPQTAPLLTALRSRYRLGCLSNTNPLHIEALEARGPHLALLHDCFFSHTIGYMKPAPAAYQHVLSAWQVAPARILFVDDRDENVAAALELGLQTVHACGPQALTAACAGLLP